jgi:hypothetical protein
VSRLQVVAIGEVDIKAVLDNCVVDALPARTIRPSTVNQNNIPNAVLLVLR